MAHACQALFVNIVLLKTPRLEYRELHPCLIASHCLQEAELGTAHQVIWLLDDHGSKLKVQHESGPWHQQAAWQTTVSQYLSSSAAMTAWHHSAESAGDAEMGL